MFNTKCTKGGTVGTVRAQGNTDNLCPKRTRQRARSWCFTLNNHKENDVAHLTQEFGRFGNNKYIFQEEIGESKTPHLQRVINFKNAIAFNTVKKINNKAHWEKCKNLKAAIKYCSKEETRSGKQWSNGIESHELWKKKVPLMTYGEMCGDMLKQNLKDEDVNLKAALNRIQKDNLWLTDNYGYGDD